jgi:heptosyltransferase-2
MEPVRILIVSPNWIGDAVMAQPLIRLLHEQYPDRLIDVLAPSWVAPVWEAMSEVDSVIRESFRHGKAQLKERWKCAKALKGKYAEAYVLPNSLKSALIPWLAGIPKRIGYLGEKRYGLLNAIHRDSRTQPRAMVAFYASLAKAPTKQAISLSELPKPALKVAADAQALFERLGIPAGSRLIAFAPGAEFGSAKRWPASYFAQLAKVIYQALPETRILLLGSGKDKPVCEEITKADPRVQNLAGLTSLTDAIHLIAISDAVVSNDSGLLHIASAFNRPVIAIYGPTHPGHAPPFSDRSKSIWLNLDCAPCAQRECPLGHHLCMRHISPDMVWNELQVVMRENHLAH